MQDMGDNKKSLENNQKAIVSAPPISGAISSYPVSSLNSDPSAWLAMKSKHDETKLKLAELDSNNRHRAAELEATNRRLAMGADLAKDVGGQLITFFGESRKAETATKLEVFKGEMQDRREDREAKLKMHQEEIALKRDELAITSGLKEKELNQEHLTETEKLQFEREKLAWEKEKFAAKREEQRKAGMFAVSARQANQGEESQRKISAKANSFTSDIMEALKGFEQSSILDEQARVQLTGDIKEYLVKNSFILKEIIGQDNKDSFVTCLAKEMAGSLKDLIADFESHTFILDEAVEVWQKSFQASNKLG